MRRRFHIALFLLSGLLLTACEQVPETSQQMRDGLMGDWEQTDGSASLRFYDDNTVMVRLPDRTPPLNFLSTYEPMKNGQIGIDTGQIWMGPITCDWKKGSKVMRVIIPDKEKVVLRLTKQ